MLRVLNVDLVLGELWTRVLSPDLAAAATCFARRGLVWVLCSPVGGRGRALMVLAQVYQMHSHLLLFLARDGLVGT